MSRIVTSRIAELAQKLGDLRFRLRQAARREVALAVGDALKEIAHVWICGPVRDPYARRPASSWADPWEEEDPWADSPQSFSQEDPMFVRSSAPTPSRIPLALAAALGGARWGLTRTQNVFPAVAIGIVTGIVVYAGGSSVDTVVRLWLNGAELTSAPDRGRTP
jgi:hypothetical protein